MINSSNPNPVKRCPWCGSDPLYIDYHDNEWGRLVTDENVLFEFLILEGAQAGISWITVLRKREAYRKAFAGFDPRAVAAFGDEDVSRLMNDERIVRNRLKIVGAINNARLFLKLQEEFGSFKDYLMQFFDVPVPEINDVPDMTAIPVSNPISDAISKDMKKRGFKFFGTTICYAFLQATGFIDDHENDCVFKSPL